MNQFQTANQNASITEMASAAVLSEPVGAVESRVRAYFAKTPVLIDIARCESHFKQFASDGSVLRGMAVKSDVGVMQVNEYYHSEDAEKLGLDLHTLEGNLAFAKWLYEKEGTQPWSASVTCWNR